MGMLKRVRSLLREERLVFPKLELHVAHGCNLACESCSHYSNHAHSGTVSLDDADRWMGLWSRRVSVTRFSLLGGEPTIHPQLPQFVGLVRRHWPHTQIEIVSNGFFLHATRAAILRRTRRPPCHLRSSRSEVPRRLKPVFAAGTMAAEHGFVAVASGAQELDPALQGFGDTMLPFEDGDPRASWEACPARHCKQLLVDVSGNALPRLFADAEGKIPPCRQMGSLSPSPLDLIARVPDGAFAAPEDEAACGMCPAKERLFNCRFRAPAEC